MVRSCWACVLYTIKLVALNTIYQHKDIYKYTWKSKGRGHRSIFDYFIVKKALRHRVADVKVIRGAELDICTSTNEDECEAEEGDGCD